MSCTFEAEFSWFFFKEMLFILEIDCSTKDKIHPQFFTALPAVKAEPFRQSRPPSLCPRSSLTAGQSQSAAV